jgi:ABC-2 type transport system permease protein
MTRLASRPGAGRRTGTGPVAGAGLLARLAFRRDRLMLPAWIYVLTALIAGNAYSFKTLFATAAERDRLAASAGSNPAFQFLYGRLYSTSVGGMTAWRYGVYVALGAGLMSTFLVIRHSRAEEEAGRTELVGSTAVGRHAPLTAALLVAAAANVSIAVLFGIVLPLLGLPVAGSVALALATAASGLAFAGIAAVAAQLSSTARGARGLTFTVLGVAYLLQAVGNSAGAQGPQWLTWLSPLGWAGLVRPFAGERWWVLALPVAVMAVTGAAAFLLAARRDLGAGLLPDRPGPATAGPGLRGPLGLAWRLQRGTLASWTAGLLAGGLASGAAGKGVGSLLASSGQLRTAFLRLGGQAAITNAYLAAIMGLAGLVAAAYATSAVLRLHTEEAAGRADPVLVSVASRVGWWASHITVTVLGTAAVLAAAGIGTGLGYGLRAGDAGTQVPQLLGAALAQLPAALAVAAVAVLAFGVLPDWSVGIGWTALAAAVLLALFGEILQLDQWVLDISPFTHVPKLPGGTVSAVPLVWLAVIALALAAAGLAGLRRRDIA